RSAVSSLRHRPSDMPPRRPEVPTSAGLTRWHLAAFIRVTDARYRGAYARSVSTSPRPRQGAWDPERERVEWRRIGSGHAETATDERRRGRDGSRVANDRVVRAER